MEGKNKVSILSKLEGNSSMREVRQDKRGQRRYGGFREDFQKLN